MHDIQEQASTGITVEKHSRIHVDATSVSEIAAVSEVTVVTVPVRCAEMNSEMLVEMLTVRVVSGVLAGMLVHMVLCRCCQDAD